MNDIQTLFTVLAAIHYGLALNAATGYSAFDTAALFAGMPRAGARLLLAMGCLNVAPFVWFLFVLRCLEPYCAPTTAQWGLAFGSMSASLVVFGIYRVFAGLAVLPRRGRLRDHLNRPLLFFYDDVNDVADDESKRRAREVRCKVPILSWEFHLMGGLGWCLVFGLLFCCIVGHVRADRCPEKHSQRLTITSQ